MACLVALVCPHVALAVEVWTTAEAQAASPPASTNSSEQAPPSADELLARLLQKESWTWQDIVQRGHLAMEIGDYAGALVAFEAAGRLTSDPAARQQLDLATAFALNVLAQTLPSGSDNVDRHRLLNRSGQILNELQALQPQNVELATLRVQTWALVDDKLEVAAAMSHRNRLDDQQGELRFGLFEGVVTLIVVTQVGGWALEHYQFSSVLTAEQHQTILNSFRSSNKALADLLKVIDLFKSPSLEVNP